MNQYLSQFNPQTKVPFLEYSKLTSKLKVYSDLFKDKSKEAQPEYPLDKKTDTSFFQNQSVVDWSILLEVEVQQLQTAVKSKLIQLFFGVSEDTITQLDYSEFMEMYDMIVQARPEIVNFLFLNKIGVI